MDFYDYHSYFADLAEHRRHADYYGTDRPLTFLEWGGAGNVWELAHPSEEPLRWDTVDHLLDLVEEGKLAGHSFWSWQDIPEFCRIDAEMREGILAQGVVTEDRQLKPHVAALLSRLFEGRRREPARPTCAPLGKYPWADDSRFAPVDLQSMAESESATAAWADLETRLAEFWAKDGEACLTWGKHWKRHGEKFRLWEVTQTLVGTVPFVTPRVGHHIRPLVLTPAVPQIDIPILAPARQIHILGHVTLPSGYPLRGRPGEQVASYRVTFSDGATEEIALRHGYEVARANVIGPGTRLNPIAVNAPRALCFVKDVAAEQYQALLYSIPVGGRRVERLTCQLQSQDLCLMLLAVTLEHP